MSLDRVREALLEVGESAEYPGPAYEELATHEKEDEEVEAHHRSQIVAFTNELARLRKEDEEREAHWLRHHERIHAQLQELLEAAKSVLAVEFISKLHGHPYSTLRQVIQNIEKDKA